MDREMELLILAAGRSTRMGSPKGLLQVHGIALLEYTIKQGLAYGWKVRVVIEKGQSPYSDLLRTFGDTILIFENDHLEWGPFYSLQCGITSAAKILLGHVDRLLPPSCELKKLSGEEDIISAVSSRNEGGHPLVLNHRVLNAICMVKDCETERLDNFLNDKRWTKKKVITDHPLFYLNINTPSDYQKLLQLV